MKIIEKKIINNQYKVINTYKGGMGYVHLCLDTKNNDFPVALKTFLPEFLPDINLRERFIREATIWIDLGYHPNIVQAYKVVHVADDQTVYIIMQLIPPQNNYSNSSLRTQLNEGQGISEQRCLEIILGVVRGMIYAVNKIPSLVHRDLKPENILISSTGEAKITDFGIASVSSIPVQISDKQVIDWHDRNITQGIGLGTPPYMAPEQWDGINVDQRADIYSVGCILYVYY